VIQGTGIEMKEGLGATEALMSEITFLKLLERYANTV
jgi:hypothetical protein